jgi:hypothetical protein
MMETVCTSQTSVSFKQTTRRYTPEDCRVQTRRRKNLKSHKWFQFAPSHTKSLKIRFNIVLPYCDASSCFPFSFPLDLPVSPSLLPFSSCASSPSCSPSLPCLSAALVDCYLAWLAAFRWYPQSSVDPFFVFKIVVFLPFGFKIGIDIWVSLFCFTIHGHWFWFEGGGLILFHLGNLVWGSCYGDFGCFWPKFSDPNTERGWSRKQEVIWHRFVHTRTLHYITGHVKSCG